LSENKLITLSTNQSINQSASHSAWRIEDEIKQGLLSEMWTNGFVVQDYHSEKIMFIQAAQ
jgi:hypothetical protein